MSTGEKPATRLWREALAQLDELLEKPPPQRLEMLAEIGRTHPHLHSMLVSLLDADERAARAGFLDPPRPGEGALAPGAQLGPYRIESRIGAGGMGEVWLARRDDGLYQGQVAIKTLHPYFGGGALRERFLREAQILGRLQHPGIARLLDAGVEAGRQPYLVLEYVRGQRIDEYCAQRGLGIQERIRLFLDVLAAVAHAHSNLVVHRDLKPSNIFVTEQGEVKLLDFGIAALLSADGDDLTPLTRHMGPGLTPGYASPEQLLGQPITTAADVFALGTVLFELLAGRRPWSTREEPKTSAELIRLKLEADAPRLSDAAEQEQWRRSLRGDLDNIVAMALRRNAAERYRTAEAFAHDLRRHLAHEPVSARPRSLRYVIAKFVQRNRAAVLSASVMVAALIVAGAFSFWQMVQANEQRRLAEDQASRAEFSRDFAEFVLTDAGTTGRPFTTRELLARAEQALETYGSTYSPVAIEQVMNLGMLYARVGQYRRALELFEKAHARAVAGNHAELRWQSACELGRMHHYAGRVQQSVELLDSAIAELQRQVPNSPALIECLELRSDLELTRQLIPAAIASARASLAQAQKVFPRAQVHWISPRVQLATALRAASQYQVADDLHRGTLALLKELGRERTTNAVLLYNSWGIVRSDIGDILGAAQLFESGLAIGHALWGNGTPDQWVSVTYGRRLVLLNRLDEAQAYFSSALRASSGEDDAEMEAGALIGLLSVSREKGDFAAAQAARARADQFIEAHLPAEHTQRMNFAFESGLLDLADGSLDDGKARLQLVLSRLEHEGRRVPDQIVALAGLARGALQSGEPARANELATEASTLARKFALAGRPSYWLGLALLVQVDVEQALGHTARARELSVEALSQLTASVGADHPLTRKAAALAR